MCIMELSLLVMYLGLRFCARTGGGTQVSVLGGCFWAWLALGRPFLSFFVQMGLKTFF